MYNEHCTVQRKITAPVYRGPDSDLDPAYKLDPEYFISNYRMVIKQPILI